MLPLGERNKINCHVKCWVLNNRLEASSGQIRVYSQPNRGQAYKFTPCGVILQKLVKPAALGGQSLSELSLANQTSATLGCPWSIGRLQSWDVILVLYRKLQNGLPSPAVCSPMFFCRPNIVRRIQITPLPTPILDEGAELQNPRSKSCRTSLSRLLETFTSLHPLPYDPSSLCPGGCV